MNKENAKKWAIAIGVMLVIQCFSMIRNRHHMETTDGWGASRQMHLQSPMQQWIDDVKGSDNSAYLMVAKNMADGNGVSFWCDYCQPQRFMPWLAWAPGTPLALSYCIRFARWAGVSEMYTIFYVWNIFEVIVGTVILLILWQFTQNLWAMVATAIFCGWCPPVQHWYYDWSMVNSEFGTQVPLAFFFLFLTLSFLAYWKQQSWKKICLLFGLTGFFLSMAGMARASLLTVGPYIIVASAIIFWLRRKSTPTLKIGLTALAFFYIGLQVFPSIAKVWNHKRVGRYVVFDGTSWLTVFWQPYGTNGFVIDSGLGIGDYLDPAKGAKLRQDNPGNAVLFWEYFKTVMKNPFKAIYFKVKRLPMLFFNTAPFPRSELNTVGIFCLFFYGGLIGLILMLRKAGFAPPEVLYLYFIFMICAAAIIHFEYRYTNALWMPLRIVPGLLVATLIYRWKNDKEALKLQPAYAV